MRDQIVFAGPAERFAIPLNEAWYCESCQVILNCPDCFCCASAGHTQRLRPWLDREPINLPPTGVFLSVVPDGKKRPEKESYAPPRRVSRAS